MIIETLEPLRPIAPARGITRFVNYDEDNGYVSYVIDEQFEHVGYTVLRSYWMIPLSSVDMRNAKPA